MQPTPTQFTNNTLALKRLRGSGSSGRNRPGSRQHHADQHDITLTAPPRQQPPSANDFPPLGFNALLDGNVFGGMSGGTAGHTITGILARPPGTKEGTMGLKIGQNVLARRNIRPGSISANYDTPIGDFMGGKRGEREPDKPEVSSYIGPPQYSRRGNLLPPPSIVSGLSARSSNAPVPFNINSVPNPFSMTAAAGTSLTHRSAPYEIGKNFDRLRIQGTHLGLSNSPYFPKCKEDLVKHREERKNDAKDDMNKRIRDKEEMMRLKSMEGCEGALVRIKPAFGGTVFRDGLSGVFAQKTIWGHPSLHEKMLERAEWPTLTELKQAGTRKTGLPIPRYKSVEIMAGEDVTQFAGNRTVLPRRRVEQVMFDEEKLEEMGEMKRLFEAIDR